MGNATALAFRLAGELSHSRGAEGGRAPGGGRVSWLLAFLGFKKVKKVRAPERAIHQAQETTTILKRH